MNGHSHTLAQYTIDGKGAYITTGAGALVNTADQFQPLTRAKVAGDDIAISELAAISPSHSFLQDSVQQRHCWVYSPHLLFGLLNAADRLHFIQGHGPCTVLRLLKYYKDDKCFEESGHINMTDIIAVRESQIYDAPEYSLDLVSNEIYYTVGAESQISMIRWAYAFNVARGAKPFARSMKGDRQANSIASLERTVTDLKGELLMTAQASTSTLGAMEKEIRTLREDLKRSAMVAEVAEQERLRLEQEKQRLEDEKARIEEERARIEEERARASNQSEG
ncbi:unnamed protein product [Sphagnum compactum]